MSVKGGGEVGVAGEEPDGRKGEGVVCGCGKGSGVMGSGCGLKGCVPL